MAQLVSNLPAVQETWVRSLGWKDPLEKEMANHCSIPARRIPRTEEPGRLQTMGSQSQTQLSDSHFHFFRLVPPQDSLWNEMEIHTGWMQKTCFFNQKT